MTTIPPTTTGRTKACDGASVGVILERAGCYLIGQRADGQGVAPVAGHVYDAHTGYEDAAVAEVREELGLTVTHLEPVTTGWRDNRCKRGTGPSGRYGHAWAVYRADVTGSMHVDPGSYSDVWAAYPDELAALAARTVAMARGELDARAWAEQPGLEPVWVLWLARADAIQPTAHDLADVERLVRTGLPDLTTR